MSNDLNGQIPYLVQERMVTFATPYDRDVMINVGAGSSLSGMVRARFPHSPVVSCDRLNRDSASLSGSLEHCFDRVFCYVDTPSGDSLLTLTSLGRNGAAVVVSFPLRPHWAESYKACAGRLAGIEDVAWLGAPTVVAVKTKDGEYGVARYSNYVPVESVNDAGRDLARAAGFIQLLSEDQGFYWWLSTKHLEHPVISQVLDIAGPVINKGFQEIISYLCTRRIRPFGGTASLNPLADIQACLEEMQGLRDQHRTWLVHLSEHPYDPTLDLE